GPHVGIQVELLTHRHVDRAIPAADRRRERPLQTEPRAPDGIEGRVGKRCAGFVDGGHAAVLLVPVELDPQRGDCLQRGGGDFGPNTVAGNERGFPVTHGTPGVRLLTARVSAVQTSTPVPCATVRKPILPMRESIMTTDSSALTSPGRSAPGC